MKLLPPKELNTKLNDQKKSEYDAGMFLAKKIDKLREELADTEKDCADKTAQVNSNLEIFLEEISKEKENVLKEIESLKEERRILRIPLDTEWEKVKRESQNNSDLSIALITKEFEIKKEDKEIQRLSEDLIKRGSEIKYSEIKAKNYLEFAWSSKEKAEKIILDAQRYEIKTKQGLEIREQAVSKRETDIAYREIDVQNNLKIIVESKEWIKKEKSHIEARQRALKVNEKNYGNNNSRTDIHS